MPRVLRRHLQEARLLPPLGDVHADAFSLSLAQPRFARLGLGQLHRQEQLLGDERPRLVVLVEEAGEQLLGGKLLLAEAEAAPAGEPPAAEEEQLQLEQPALAVEAEHVLVDRIAQDRPLLLQAALDGVQLVAQLRRALVLELRRRVLHPRGKLRGELVGLAFQEERDLLDAALVILLRHAVHARRRATLDLVLQARPPPVGHHLVGARAQLEVPVDDAERLADGRRARVRPEVTGAVLAHPAHHLQPRVGVRA